MTNPSEIAGSFREKVWNKHFIFAFAANLFVCFAMFMLNSTLARYILSLFGNATFSGYINAAFAVFAILARLVTGDLCDRRGRRMVLLLGAAVFAVSTFGFGIFQYAAALLIFRALHGFGYATANTASSAAGADVLPENRMSEGISYLGLGYSIATAIGSAIALSLVRGDDYSLVFYVATGMVVISIFFALFLRYERLPFYQKKMQEQKQRSAAIELSEYKGAARIFEFKAVPSALVQFFNSMSFAAVNFFIVIYADSKGITGEATFFTTMAVGMMITRTFCGRLSDKIGESRIGGGALCVQVIALISLINVTNNTVFYIIGFFIGLAFGTVSPVLQAAAIKKSPVNRKGAASSTYQLGNDIAQGAGAVLWGLIIDYLGFSSAFIGCIICTAFSFILLMVFFRKRRLPKAI